MNNNIGDYIRAMRIDSFQKLRFLLFLYQQPDLKGTCQEFAERLYLGDIPLLTEIIFDLHQMGLLEQIENCYTLRNEVDIKICLKKLAAAFEDPLARQELIDQIRYKASFNTDRPEPSSLLPSASII